MLLLFAHKINQTGHFKIDKTKMISGYNNVINVTHIRQRNKSANITCTISSYKDILKKIEIGQSITTSESFDLKFPDFDAKWMLIYYPKGQYDCGVASDSCRIYVKMLSSDKGGDVLKMNIKATIQSSTSFHRSHSLKYVSEFNLNDKNKSWAGPFEMDTIKDFKDNLIIKCEFEMISNEDTDKFSSKRALSEVNHPISSKEPIKASKKTRCVSPEAETENTTERNLTLSANKRYSKFKYQDPSGKAVLPPEKQEKRKDTPDIERKDVIESNWVTRRNKNPSGIFTSEEREMYKSSNRLSVRRTIQDPLTNYFNQKTASTPTSSRLSLQKQTDNTEPKTFRSSKCLQVSDIFRAHQEDNETEHGDKGVMNSSVSNSRKERAQEAMDEEQQNKSVNKRVSYFENLSKGCKQ